MDMDNHLTIDLRPCSTLIPSEAVETIIDEGPKVCPLCSSDIRLFYINFNEKLLMCENTQCDYPFGHEEIQLVKVENYEDISDFASLRTKQSMMSPSRSSIVSAAAWSEIDKMNKVTDDLEESQIDMAQFERSWQTKKKNKIKLTKDSKIKIQKHAEELKDLDMDLMKIKTDTKMINNEKWIKNLMSLQGISGKSLLQPQELIKLKKQTECKKSELKIDIEKGEGMSSITIHLGNKETSSV